MKKVLAFPLTRLVIIAVACVAVTIAITAAGRALRHGAAPGAGSLGLTLAVNWLLAVAVLAITAIVERSTAGLSLAQIGFAPRYALRDLTLGVVLGGLFFSIVVSMLAAGGYYHVSAIRFSPAVFGAALLFAAGALFEETFFRGVVFRLVREWLGAWPALAVSAAFFGVAHAANPGASWISTVAIALEAGLLLAAAYLVTNNLWLPIGIHFAWNFCEGPIFGTQVSGGTLTKGIFEATLSGPSWITGGAFGPEAGVFAIATCLVASTIFLVYAIRKGNAMLKSVSTVGALVLALGLVSSAKAASVNPDLSRAYNGFGFTLFSDLVRQNAGKNTFISPTSISVALAIAANGAGGTTRSAMLETLETPGASADAFDASNKALMSELDDPGSDLQFTIANALWLNKQFSIVPAFVTTSHDIFSATAQDLPFGDPSAAQTINDWVDKNTNGRIPEIIDSTSPDDVLVITNAIAMKAKWLVPFDKNDTADQPFETGSGGHVTVSMMSSNNGFAYADRGGWQVARLPYRGDRFAMYVLLPHQGTALRDALRSFDGAAFDREISGLTEQRIAFAMPRYTATYKAELNEPLERLGMAQAFEAGKADFSNMVEPPQRAYISLVVHRAFVRVDEEGTEAAAATAIGMRATAIMMPPEKRMIVDRPFLMAIRDDKTKQILFLGAIYDPERPT